MVIAAARQYAFEPAPLLHHAGKQFRPAGIEGRIKFHRNAHRGWRCHHVGCWRFERGAVVEALFERHFKPTEYF